MSVAWCFAAILWILPQLSGGAESDSRVEPPQSGTRSLAGVDQESGVNDSEATPARAETVQIIFDGRQIDIPLDGSPVQLGETGMALQLKSKLEHGEPVGGTEEIDNQIANRGDVDDVDRSIDASKQNGLTWQALVPWIALATILLGIVVWFGIISPMRRRAPLVMALKILNQDARHEFSEAEEMLGHSLLAGMKKKDIVTARFALAYVRVRLSRFDEAAVVLHDLERDAATAVDGPIAYLMMRVYSRLGNHERVERIYNEYQNLVSGYDDARLLASISYLALARMHWARREINGAMHYFDQVRKLDVLSHEIPSHIDDHEVVMGTMSLFEDNHDAAVMHFTAAVKAADQSGKPTWTGDLGLLLCEWRKEESPDIDDRLTEIITEMQSQSKQENEEERVIAECTHCGKKYRVPLKYEGRRVKCRGCRKKFQVETKERNNAESQDEERQDVLNSERFLSEEEQLMRNIRLWLCVSLILKWLRREPKSGLPAKERRLLDLRIDAVIDLDPEFSDPLLIRSLINYYFAETNEEREAAHDVMKQAIELGVHVPEVLQLSERENKWSELVKNRYTFLDQIIGDHLDSSRHDPDQVERLVRSLSRFERYRQLVEDCSQSRSSEAAPSVKDLRHRTDITRTRVSNYINRLAKDLDHETRDDIQSKLNSLEDKTAVLADQVRSVEKLTTDVVIITAQEDLRDEEVLQDDAESNGDEQSALEED